MFPFAHLEGLIEDPVSYVDENSAVSSKHNLTILWLTIAIVASTWFPLIPFDTPKHNLTILWLTITVVAST
jgi:hypothetical protein